MKYLPFHICLITFVWFKELQLFVEKYRIEIYGNLKVTLCKHISIDRLRKIKPHALKDTLFIVV